jgi:CBS domain-containing protein
MRASELNVLKGLTVQDAMRRQVIGLAADSLIHHAIRAMVKYKVNAILITGPDQEGLGVVSKTDIMTAYYGGLPLDTPLEGIMVGPPCFSRPQDSLEAALEVMQAQRIHRLYVEAERQGRAVGVLAYPDIVGLLYRFCHPCDRSILKGRGRPAQPDLANHFRVREVMTPEVTSFPESASLAEVMEGLAATRLAAVLISGADGQPVGVASKTDLALAYLHQLPHEAPVRDIMSAPVVACPQEELLALAIKRMIFADIHRMFAYKDTAGQVVGVLSLSDAARFRSGTCRACLSSRIKIS